MSEGLPLVALMLGQRTEYDGLTYELVRLRDGRCTWKPLNPDALESESREAKRAKYHEARRLFAEKTGENDLCP